MSTGSSAALESREQLEAVIKDEVFRMYQEVAEHPEGDFHFFHGREAASCHNRS